MLATNLFLFFVAKSINELITKEVSPLFSMVIAGPHNVCRDRETTNIQK